MLTVAATLTYRHELDKVRNVRAMNSEQAILLVLSAESWARSILRDDVQNNDFDSFEDDWAQVIPVLPVEGGTMTGCITDLQAKFNINNLGGIGQQAYENALTDDIGDNVETYLNLLEFAALDWTPERAAYVVDWIDPDSEMVTPGSAEDAEYSLEDPPRLAANSRLSSLSELVAVYGYSLADVQALDRLATALPADTAVNVNTADAGVLRSLSTLIDDYMVEGIVEQRPFENLDDFYQALEEEINYMSQTEIRSLLPESMITVQSNFFELRAQVQIQGENIALASVFQRSGRNEVRTLARTFQYIPDLILEEDEVNPVRPLCDQNYGLNAEEEGYDLLN